MGHHRQQAWIVSRAGNLAHNTCPASPDSLCHCSAGTVAGQKHLSGGQVHSSRTRRQCLMSSPDRYSLKVIPLQLGWSIHGTYIGAADCNNRY